MLSSIWARVASITVSIFLLATPSAGQAHLHKHHHHPARIRLPKDYYEWAKVAKCESNSHWEIFGSVYPDPLGITASNWANYGRMRFGYTPRPEPPTWSASISERITAIEIGDEILKQAGASIPDQYGCQAGGW